MAASPASVPQRMHNIRKLPARNFMPACVQSFLDGGNARGAAQESVECGNLAELFVAEKGEFFVRVRARAFLDGGEAVFDEAGAGIALVDEGARGKGGEGNHDKDEKCNQRWHGKYSGRKPSELVSSNFGSRFE
jgi:hypothetical protein